MEHFARFSWFRRRGIILILLFGYFILAFVTVQQHQVIDSQRTLIQTLFRDSLELSALRLQQQFRHK